MRRGSLVRFLLIFDTDIDFTLLPFLRVELRLGASHINFDCVFRRTAVFVSLMYNEDSGRTNAGTPVLSVLSFLAFAFSKLFSTLYSLTFHTDPRTSGEEQEVLLLQHGYLDMPNSPQEE